jgi:DNA-binding GntR family transcriptional regulator
MCDRIASGSFKMNGCIEQTMRAEESWVSETVVEGITERLTQAITTGVIRPGDLERKFGFSHIPICEALRWLQYATSKH